MVNMVKKEVQLEFGFMAIEPRVLKPTHNTHFSDIDKAIENAKALHLVIREQQMELDKILVDKNK